MIKFEVLNPSEVFLEERLDGRLVRHRCDYGRTRRFWRRCRHEHRLCLGMPSELQLVLISIVFSSLIMAVLEKRAGLLLQNQGCLS